MDLEHVGVEVVGELGNSRSLERPGGDDNLVGLYHSVIEHELEPVAVLPQRTDGTARVNRKGQRLGVVVEIGDHLVTGRVAVGVTREIPTRQAVVAAGREKNERIPAGAPSGCN